MPIGMRTRVANTPAIRTELYTALQHADRSMTANAHAMAANAHGPSRIQRITTTLPQS